MALKQQRGNTLVGFIIGLVVGLTIALGLAIYVTKMPIPFMNKGQTRSSEADSAEDKKNKDWDPNAPLYGKNPAKSADKADGETKADGKADSPAKPDAKSADPIAGFAKAKPTESKPFEVKSVEPKPSEDSATNDPFIYFVQAGAFRTADEAEAQRAKLGFLGLDARLSEREQGGRTVYRVRVGPIDKVEAERVRSKLESAHIESAMVRVQR
jgi:cell division protein FtsN